MKTKKNPKQARKEKQNKEQIKKEQQKLIIPFTFTSLVVLKSTQPIKHDLNKFWGILYCYYYL